MVRRAARIARDEAPDLLIDGEMRLDCGARPDGAGSAIPDCIGSAESAPTCWCSRTLDAANSAVNLLRLLGDNPVVGPVMLGLEKPVHVLQPHSAGVSDLVHMTAIACMDAVPEPVGS